MFRFWLLRTGVLLLASAPLATAQAAELTVEQAIERALTRSPQLLATAADTEVASARLRAARVWWRPTLDVSFENVLGDGPYADFDAAETTWSLSQELAFGAGRTQAIRGTAAGAEAALAELESVKRELRRDVVIAYAEAIAADRIADIAQRQSSNAAATNAAVERRFLAGLESELQRAQSVVELSAAQAAARRARGESITARRALARFWRDDEVIETLNQSWFDRLDESTVTATVTPKHPSLQRAELHLQESVALLAQQRAQRFPAVSATFGVRRFADAAADSDQAFVLGFSVPLQFTARNAEGIAAARADNLRAELAVEDIARDLKAKRATAAEELEAARLEARTLVERAVPAARLAAELTLRGYESGRVSLLDRLAAERALSVALTQEVRAKLALHRARAVLQELQ